MNWYAQAVELLMSEKVDFRAVAVEVAKRHPKVLVEAIKRTDIAASDWKRECLAMMKERNLIGAIKHCRNVTGMGLKDAKDAVEALV